ncbi:MAG: hypothetical protein HRU09_11180 [Oligoflexales bacterium]|nr:hypothetical protein [Oligoflexales bacterium]
MSLVDDIEEVIENYLRKSKYYSLHTLAQKSGIGYTTIRRLAQKEAGRPNADTVINLIDAALGPAERIAFLKKHFPKISNLLEDVYKNQTHSSYNELNDTSSGKASTALSLTLQPQLAAPVSTPSRESRASMA